MDAMLGREPCPEKGASSSSAHSETLLPKNLYPRRKGPERTQRAGDEPQGRHKWQKKSEASGVRHLVL